MPPVTHSTNRGARFGPTVGVIPFLFLAGALILGTILGAGPAAAQETTSETTLQTTSGTTSNLPEEVSVDHGEASINGGDVYAGNGCAKAGDVVAGDCAGKGKGDGGTEESTPNENTPEETTAQENALPQEDTSSEETTVVETTPPETTAPAEDELCPPEPPEDAVEATVERAVDGDTLKLAEEVEGSDEVRLIGVDTPELEGQDGASEPYAEEAATFTADALEGQTVLLQVGQEVTDDYGRLLAYVWTSEAMEEGVVGGLKRMVGVDDLELFNRTLLEEGYAEILTIAPNDLYAGCFEAAEQAARDEGVGIWSEDGPSDEQYGGLTVLETTTERTLHESTASEETTSEDTGDGGLESVPPDADSSDENLSQGPAGDDSSTQPQYRSEPVPADEADSDPDTQDASAEQESVGQEPGEQEPARSQYTEPSLSEDPVARPLTREAADAPAQAPAQQTVYEPFATQISGVPDASLPTHQTTSGSIAVLPETGGTSVLPLLAGAFCLAGGVLSFVVLRGGPDRRGFCPEGR